MMTYDDFRDRITYNIEKLMHKKRMTQTKLADRAGIAQGSVSSMMTGNRDSSLFMLWAIAVALEVEPQELLREVGHGKDIYLRKRKKVQGAPVGHRKRQGKPNCPEV